MAFSATRNSGKDIGNRSAKIVLDKFYIKAKLISFCLNEQVSGFSVDTCLVERKSIRVVHELCSEVAQLE